MHVRSLLRGALWTGGLLLAALAVSGTLWLILLAVGDYPGSQGAKGVALFAIVCLVLVLVGIVVLLALAEIWRDRGALAEPVAPERIARDQSSGAVEKD
jgi:hypothetical protein